MERDYSRELLRFIQNHPSPYHVVEGQKQRLLEAGYEQLLESRSWSIREGGKYFLTRNGSSIVAFRVPKKTFSGFMIMASHSDSPMLKIKENPEITVDGRSFALEKGDSIHFLADAPHAYRNPGQETAELSMLIYYGRAT